jgi:hypothetical protein
MSNTRYEVVVTAKVPVTILNQNTADRILRKGQRIWMACTFHNLARTANARARMLRAQGYTKHFSPVGACGVYCTPDMINVEVRKVTR